MKRIPKQFQLLNHRITVRVLSQSEWPSKYKDAVGVWDNNKNEILLLKQPRTLLRHTFWHEATHALLDMAGQSKLSSNESFVDSLGGLLAQLNDSTEF
jgi:Zn-dependent peptidase ImmA (M78 family)